MAESVVSFVLENLVRLLEEEVRSLSGVKNQVQSLQKQLDTINRFLQTSEAPDGNDQQNDLVKEAFVEQIREVAREAEDVIDKYIVHVIKQNRRNMVVKLLHLLDVRDVASTITSIKISINECFDNKEKFGQQQLLYPAAKVDLLPVLYRSDLEVEKDVGVGFADHLIKLVNLLTDESINNTKRDVVSITGMGGSGKTKLAINIFYDSDVQQRFECRAFVSGSREYKIKDWLVDTLKELNYYSSDDQTSITTTLDDMQQQQLVRRVREKLQGRKYLVVMDGMWDNRVWNILKKAFPDEHNGSRILITSREKVVASKDDYTFPPYQLPLLNEDESWQLLSNKVFQQAGQCVDDEGEDLTHIGHQLAKNCNGLPLSIVVLGDLLKTRQMLAETWSEMGGQIKDMHEKKCLEILGESYKQLPRHLKVCFLYLGLFPKDFDISARQLIQLWSAEGFVKAAKNRDVIKVAEEYLQELIDRNLIQVTSRRSDGGVKTCRIHDLLRKLSISESRKEKFLEVHDSDDYITSAKIARTLCIQGNACQYISSYEHHRSPSARSLLLFGRRKSTFMLEKWQIIYKSFKHTRVLYFWDVRIRSIPKEIEKLVYLTYIRIGSDAEMLKIKALPASICNLPYLETIDIKGQIEETLPERIWRMKQLRHLKVSKGMRFPSRSRSSKGGESTSTSTSTNVVMNHLRILYGLVVHKNTNLIMAQVAEEFPNVEKLYLLYDKNKPLEESEVTQVFKSLENLTCLKGLKIVNFPKSGYVSNLFPSTLEKITIISSYLDSDHFRILGELRKLRFLKISNTHDDALTKFSKLSCHPGSFPKLEVFQMIDLKISKWKMDKSAMPKLRRLVIDKCDRLLCLPVQLWSLPNLDSQNVEVSHMSEYFTKFPLQQLHQDQIKETAAANHDFGALTIHKYSTDRTSDVNHGNNMRNNSNSNSISSLIPSLDPPSWLSNSSSLFILFLLFLSVFFALSRIMPWVS